MHALHKVLRLTSHLLLQPSPAQLASQAETIADLTFQRNMLLIERSEDAARWQAERECWSRSANVLFGKARVAREPLVKEQVRNHTLTGPSGRMPIAFRRCNGILLVARMMSRHTDVEFVGHLLRWYSDSHIPSFPSCATVVRHPNSLPCTRERVVKTQTSACNAGNNSPRL